MSLRPFLRALVAAFLVVVSGAAGAGAGNVMVFGDSLSAAYGLAPSQGWPALLGKRLERSAPAWQVVNASVSGETTAGGLRRLPEDLKRHKPGVVVIALGANDALRGQPIAAARANLEQMIRLARDAKAIPVLVGLMIPPNYGIDYAGQFRDMYTEIAKRTGVPLVPFLLEGLAENRDMFQADQLHPTAEAQPRILENVWPAVNRAITQATAAAKPARKS
jgi:acyl-CoA thioesterase I